MLAKTRPYWRALFLAVLLAGCLPMAAHAQGVSSSATSFGIMGNPAASGRANLASIGPNGYANALQPFLGNCCANSFLTPAHFPSEDRPPFEAGHRHHRHDDDGLITVAVPVYIPYAIGYEPEEDEGAPDEMAADAAYVSGPGMAGRQKGKRESDDAYSEAPGENVDGDAEAEGPEQPEEPVIPQPATVLVFKDGHHANVVNYAIVGDALFDFADERTRKIPLADLDLAATAKANDAMGVEFKLPPAVAPGYEPQ
ncbi:MAG: hypothetical protein WCC04_09885 [Terriglobales bacterium]